MDQLATAEHPRAGALALGRYRLVRPLGAGGMGTVWLGHDERLDRPVAVKRVPADGARGTSRGGREALTAARLAHPAIVALYEAGEEGGAWLLVSELVRGPTLGELLADGALSDRDVLRIGVALCDALAHAHERGVVHRDVKPSNVICPDGDGPPAKLTDFGIARLADAEPLTHTGDVVGTLAYMAPEQAAGLPAGPPVDVYALGLVLYEALTGENPVRAPGAAETARRVGRRLPPLARARRDLSRALARALDAAVAPAPE
ncbi:MAG: serine/threonine protein kinase, partial [Actinomycetota bacterium]|nr:serine/threonine protein kinase [Actinomycetota bacterium]